MSYKSESDLLILHTLRIKGFVQSYELVEATSLNVKNVEERLNSFQEENLVNYREGRIEGWMLTQLGRQKSQEMVTSELESSGKQEQIDSSYQRILSVNKEITGLCRNTIFTDKDIPVINGNFLFL